MQKIDWDSSLTGVQGSVSYDYYNPSTGEKLNSTEICSGATIQVKVPLNTTANDIDMALYQKYKNVSVNIYDRKSAYYTSRCVTFVNSTSSGDVTIGTRRSQAPNVSIACSTGCEFLGIDLQNYITCNCVPSNETQVQVSKSDAFTDTISASNLDVVMCTNQAFDPTIITSNPGFWCNGSFLVSTVLLISLVNLLNIGALTKHLSVFIKSDALFFKSTPSNNNPIETVENKIPQENNDVNLDNVFTIQKNQVSDTLGTPKPNPPKEYPFEVGNPKDGQSVKIEEYSKLNNENIIDENNLKIINNENLEELKNSNELVILNQGSNEPKNKLENQSQNRVENTNNFEKIKIKINSTIVSNQEIKELPLNSYTYKDYDNMTYDEIVIMDTRDFFRFYFDRLMERHIFFTAFVLKTFIVPQALRITSFFLGVSFSFALNAIFYSDSYIQQRTQSYAPSEQNNFSFVIQNQLAKSIWSVLIGEIPIALLNLLLIVPKEWYDCYNGSLIGQDIKEVKKGQEELYTKMRWRHLAFLTFSFILHMFSWYYVTVFCGVYIKSSVSWVCGGILSMMINIVIVQFSLPLIHTLMRTLARRFPKRALAKYAYAICRIIL